MAAAARVSPGRAAAFAGEGESENKERRILLRGGGSHKDGRMWDYFSLVKCESSFGMRNFGEKPHKL